MKYNVIRADSLGALEGNVENHLLAGWKCQGGICVVAIGIYMHYHQAMTYEQPEETK